jgi:hypothetical protein
MKKVISLFSMTLIAFSIFAQTASDKMYKHSGETSDVKVIKVGETTIIYKYPGEDAEQVIGKFAVNKIVYSSGRTEEICLKKGEEVRGKTSGLLMYNTAGSADKKATRKIREAAAAEGVPFILLTSDKSDGFGVKQSITKGVLYTYK